MYPEIFIYLFIFWLFGVPRTQSLKTTGLLQINKKLIEVCFCTLKRVKVQHYFAVETQDFLE